MCDKQQFIDNIKNDMRSYWQSRADSFSELRAKEFLSDKRTAWMAEIVPYLPPLKEFVSGDEQVHILDIGTGTGFFACILAGMGYRVTGIDIAEAMIAAAKNTAKTRGLEIAFKVADAEHTDLPHNSFDVIVTRNLTWCLPDLEQAYRHWRRLLKTGGILLNFDADYSHETVAEAEKQVAAHSELSKYQKEAYETLKLKLRQRQNIRPAWDCVLLESAGFKNIEVDEAFAARFYHEGDEFYNPAKMFLLRARA